jgi:hypothetical protein
VLEQMEDNGKYLWWPLSFWVVGSLRKS